MTISEFHIKQVKKELTCTDTPNKIALNKYDNKVSKIIFDFDNSITGGRLYFVMLNPVTKKYSFTPIVNSEIMIGTNVTVYPGIWKSILIAVQNDYEIVQNDIDQSKVTFVSNEFSRIVVRDNFLDEEHIESISNPSIDKLLDDFYAAWDTLEDAAIIASEAAKTSGENAEEVAKLTAQVTETYAQILDVQRLIVDYARDIEESVTHIDDVSNTVATLLSQVEDQASQVARNCTISENIKTDIIAIQQDVETLKTEAEKAVTDATTQAKLAKRYTIGDESVPESVEDNARYYAHQAQATVSSIIPMVEDAKEHIDEYVKEKEESLKGETGNVYFASFRVVDGKLKMYSDPTIDKVRFTREGSRLKYKIEM